MTKRNFTILLTIVVFALPSGAARLFGSAQESKDFAVQGLRCEYLSDPLGIDVRKPRLSWMLTPAPGVRGPGDHFVRERLDQRIGQRAGGAGN